MKLADGIVALYNRVKGNEDDFIAIGLYKKMGNELDLKFYYHIISQSRNGYIVDPKAG